MWLLLCSAGRRPLGLIAASGTGQSSPLKAFQGRQHGACLSERIVDCIAIRWSTCHHLVLTRNQAHASLVLSRTCCPLDSTRSLILGQAQGIITAHGVSGGDCLQLAVPGCSSPFLIAMLQCWLGTSTKPLPVSATLSVLTVCPRNRSLGQVSCCFCCYC